MNFRSLFAGMRSWPRLRMGGHHHVIAGTSALPLPMSDAVCDLAPFDVAADRRLTREVRKESLIPRGSLDLRGSAVARAWEKTLTLRPAGRNAA